LGYRGLFFIFLPQCYSNGLGCIYSLLPR